MSERRSARAGQSAAGVVRYLGNDLPPVLAMGPCIEVWADPTAPTAWMSAWRRWRVAVDEWARSTGWAHEGRPAMNARNLARTRHAWSRQFLIQHGEQELVDYFEGRVAEWPGRDLRVPWAWYGKESS